MNNVHERIGKRLKALREARGLSQAQLAKLCGYSSASRIGNYELGDRKISVDDAIRIGPALGISAADLLFGNDEPLDKHANKENFLSKTEENLLEMFNELPQKEKDNFIKAINTRKNELDQLYEEMKAVKEKKSKRAS
ncbi:helix-turn-helix domain-containing protein [Arsenophonus nasoniae]|uniref:Helix-turn-helix domain-containing protein n=1 Tax=Arsenophonus nasoniae TaxID=638 RepID=A0AA95K4T8_9GAMM|nr:helix-turn-helix domain-containing protein [Arsenophonus nasoniae]WGL96270.1 helix-turn-helix domain-containing protein [Arsenophonus nasoniae]